MNGNLNSVLFFVTESCQLFLLGVDKWSNPVQKAGSSGIYKKFNYMFIKEWPSQCSDKKMWKKSFKTIVFWFFKDFVIICQNIDHARNLS